MRSGSSTLLEKALLLLIVLTFAAPLALSGWLRVTHDQSAATIWLRNVTLPGTGYAFKNEKASIATVFSAQYQTGFAGDYDHRYPARELALRCTNELYLRLFNVSTMVEIGRHSSLFLAGDLREYTGERASKDQLRPLIVRLRRFQDFCAARKIPFALMITPNKAAIYPEDMPWRWQRRFLPGLRRYDAFIPLLREAGIHYVDGHQLSMDLKAKVPVPLFPTGGIHWGDQPAFATANALLRELASQGLPVEPAEKFTTKITDEPRDMQDRDLVLFLSTITQAKYPVAEITPERRDMQDRYRPNAVFVGGSFDWKILRMLDATGQFSELDFYDYYKLSKNCQMDGQVHELFRPVPPINFGTEFFAADAIVLEINEQLIRRRSHVKRFLRDALAVLPDPLSPKLPYHYMGVEPYRWGDTVLVNSGPGALNPSRLTGFMAPGEAGAFTSEPVATVRLALPAPPPDDMVLSVTAGAFLDAAHVPEQRAEVSVNGHYMGQFVWTIGGSDVHELTVPKTYLSSGQLQLEFRVARLISPAELGLNNDTRKIGIFVSKIRLHEAGK